MLWKWNLPGLCISMRPSIWQNIWASLLGCGRAWPENLWKQATKWVALPNFDNFFTIEQKLSHISCITLHCVSGKDFKQIWPNFMGLHAINLKTDLQIHFLNLYFTKIEKKIFFSEIIPTQQPEYYLVDQSWPYTIPK